MTDADKLLVNAPQQSAALSDVRGVRSWAQSRRKLMPPLLSEWIWAKCWHVHHFFAWFHQGPTIFIGVLRHMPSLIAFLILVLAAPFFVARAVIFFPVAVLFDGWRAAFGRYGISIALSFVLVAYELGNLTGYSWSRGEYVSDTELRDAAVHAAYKPLYNDLAALGGDYPGFTPEIRYWNGWNEEFQNSLMDKLVGFTRYHVRERDNRHRGDKRCGRYDVRLSDGSSGGIRQFGHCFSALRENTDQRELVITRTGTYPMTLGPRLGYFLFGLQLEPIAAAPPLMPGGYSESRISKVDFLKWKSCDPALRDDWPNRGGWWKR